MGDISEADGGDAQLLGFVDAFLGRRLGGELTESEVRIVNRHGPEPGDERQLRTGANGAVAKLVRILADADQAVGVVTDQIGVGQPETDPFRLGGGRPGGGENALNDMSDLLRGQSHGRLLSRLRFLALVNRSLRWPRD